MINFLYNCKVKYRLTTVRKHKLLNWSFSTWSPRISLGLPQSFIGKLLVGGVEFLQDGCPLWRPTNSVRVLKAKHCITTVTTHYWYISDFKNQTPILSHKVLY